LSLAARSIELLLYDAGGDAASGGHCNRERRAPKKVRLQRGAATVLTFRPVGRDYSSTRATAQPMPATSGISRLRHLAFDRVCVRCDAQHGWHARQDSNL
jgi:hypothetical protein